MKEITKEDLIRLLFPNIYPSDDIFKDLIQKGNYIELESLVKYTIFGDISGNSLSRSVARELVDYGYERAIRQLNNLINRLFHSFEDKLRYKNGLLLVKTSKNSIIHDVLSKKYKKHTEVYHVGEFDQRSMVEVFVDVFYIDSGNGSNIGTYRDEMIDIVIQALI